MGLNFIMEEIRRRWPYGRPRLIHMPALDIAFRRQDTNLFLDLGETDDFVALYNKIADDVNLLCRGEVLTRIEVDGNGREVDTATVYGGVQFTLPMNLDGEEIHLQVSCYKLEKKYRVAEYFIRGRQEVEALFKMGRHDIIQDTITADLNKNRRQLAVIGGIYAARQHGFDDDDIKRYLKKQMPRRSLIRRLQRLTGF